MSTAHTPGPWVFSRDDQLGDTRFYVAQADVAPYTPNYSDVATLIAETVSGEYVRIQEANARLISAAPELLEALEAGPSVEHELPLGKVCKCSQCHFVRLRRAAIAKARGGAQ